MGEEMEEREDEGLEGLVEKGLGGRERVEDDGGGVRSGNHHVLVEVGLHEGGVEGEECGEEERRGGGEGGEDLVTD